MDFGLTEEQELLRDTLQTFVANECPVTRLRELFDAETDDDPGLWRGLVEMGIAGLAIPEAHGGAGLELLELALVSEVLGAGAVPVPFLGNALAGLALAEGGSPAQQTHWLPLLAGGDALGTIALAEEGSVWDPEAWTLPVRDGRLRGEKMFVPAASHADLFVVGVEGGDLVLVPRDADGVTVEPQDIYDRTRRVGRVRFDATPCEALRGGAATARRVRDAGCVLLAADAVGAAWSLVEQTAAYTGTREQFGTKLAQFQGVKHQIANMAVEVEPSRGLFWYAAHAFDHIPDAAERSAALAKAHASDRGLHVARDAVELHGGLGFTWECDVQMWYKRLLFDRVFLGTPETHRERNAALAGW